MGDTRKAFVRTPEHCRKISEAHKGRVKSAEHRANLALANVGKKLPTEHKAAISAGLLQGRAPTINTGYHRARRLFEVSACERCGATTKLHRHHVDEDPHNNVPDNIEILCASCHLYEHASRKRERQATK